MLFVPTFEFYHLNFLRYIVNGLCDTPTAKCLACFFSKLLKRRNRHVAIRVNTSPIIILNVERTF